MGVWSPEIKDFVEIYEITLSDRIFAGLMLDSWIETVLLCLEQFKLQIDRQNPSFKN